MVAGSKTCVSILQTSHLNNREITEALELDRVNFASVTGCCIAKYIKINIF